MYHTATADVPDKSNGERSGLGEERVKIGKHDVFERRYMGKFRALAAHFGEFVEYERDRAGRDIGLHLTTTKKDGGELVSPSLVWFQLKGIHKTTLSANEFSKRENLSIRIETQHLRFWYVIPEPTFLVVYVEAADTFFVRNAQKYVHDNFADSILTDDRETIEVIVDKDSILDEQAFNLILLENNLKAWQRRIHDDEKFARIFFRDANLLKRISTAQKRGVDIIFMLRKYGSKMRSEIHIYERSRDGNEETEIHQHWHFAMPELEIVFPYLTLHPDQEDAESEWGENEDENLDWGPLKLPSGEMVYPDGVFEMVEYRMRAKLNRLGKAWLRTLSIMEKAGFIEIDDDELSFVSVAPWHTRDV